MSTEVETITPKTDTEAKVKSAAGRTIVRVLRYTLFRLVSLFLTVVVALFLTVMIANMGGYVDRIRAALIREGIQTQFLTDPALRRMQEPEKTNLMNSRIWNEEERQGLHQPFLLRAVRYVGNALVLDLGRATYITSNAGSRDVATILLERLPATLLLWTSASIIMFFVNVFSALALSRKYGSFIDKLVVGLAPSSAAPAWFYGIFVILIFAAVLKILPFGGMVEAPPPENPLEYAGSLLEHMVLPLIAFALAYGISGIYAWRTFFLIFSSEDYVEMAKAKGLTDRNIERRYILRPTLPAIITNFALLLVFSWSGATIFETIFNWPGLGLMFYSAVLAVDTAIIVGQVVIFCYLLSVSVFLLDFIYALVDPRVKVGGGERKAG